jgi:hypothetical protein
MSSICKYSLGQWNDAAYMVARREFGHDSTVSLVHRHLRVQCMGQKAARGVVHRKAGFIARGLDA